MTSRDQLLKLMENTINCKQCGAKIDEIDVFPGKICINCHERKFNTEVIRTGALPRPDFTKVIAK